MKLKNILSKSISAKLISLFLAVSLIPVAIIGVTSYLNSKRILISSIDDKLSSVVNSRVGHVQDFLTMSLDAVTNGSSRILYRENLEKISNGVDVENLKAKLQQSLEDWAAQSNVIYRAKILDLKGNIVATAKSVYNDLGTSRADSTYFKEGLKKPFISDPYISKDDHVSMITYTCPIYKLNSEKEVIGVMVIHQATDSQINKGSFWGEGIGINKITTNAEGMGKTGETYLVNKNGLMLTPSRFGENYEFNTKINESTLKFILSKETMNKHKNYRELQTIGIGHNIANTNWYLIGEFDTNEVLAPIKKLGTQMFIMTVIFIVVIIFIAFLIANNFTKPVIEITNVAKAMAVGNLDLDISVSSDDEIGQLAKSFKTMQTSLKEKAESAQQISAGNLTVDIVPLSEKDTMGYSFQTMVNKLRTQLTDISEGINVLASSSSEIMASVTQMASSSAETATAVGETTTTVEEVKQTAVISNNKAKTVSDNATKMTEISSAGNKAIVNTIEGMSKIKSQMNAIAGMVVKLSEQSQTIGEITATVNELAEQSNLLAVNAAIEAAKAGEQGKGFTVVAQEIKQLANRSKEATAQVRTILREVQKSISSAVMATEEGTKAVDEGLRLTNISGETIQTLSESISEASNAALQIAASSQQQLEGMDQMVIAMENIREASIQAATSTQQSADSVTELQKLGHKLDDMMKQYKLS